MLNVPKNPLPRLLTQEICSDIFRHGDGMMAMVNRHLQDVGLYVEVNYGEGSAELCPGNYYWVNYNDRTYAINLQDFNANHRCITEKMDRWIYDMIACHNMFSMRAYYIANTLVDKLHHNRTARLSVYVKEWGYNILEDDGTLYAFYSGTNHEMVYPDGTITYP